jgi:hypothetical protein
MNPEELDFELEKLFEKACKDIELGAVTGNESNPGEIFVKLNFDATVLKGTSLPVSEQLEPTFLKYSKEEIKEFKEFGITFLSPIQFNAEKVCMLDMIWIPIHLRKMGLATRIIKFCYQLCKNMNKRFVVSPITDETGAIDTILDRLLDIKNN